MEDKKKIKLLLRYLTREEDYEVDSINQTDWDDNLYDVNEGDREYLVLEEDDIQDAVADDIRSTIDDCGGLSNAFSQYFVDNLLYQIDDDVWYEYVREELEWKFDNMDAQELWDYLRDELNMDMNGYTESGEFEEDEVDEDQLRKDAFDEELNGIGSYIDWLQDNIGDSSFLYDFLDSNWENYFSIYDIADECIGEDGAAHFLASYDGCEIDLGDNYYAFRVN